MSEFTQRQKKKSELRPVGKVEGDAPEPTQLPEPAGYKLLIMLPEASETTDGGIIKSVQTRHYEEIGSICGYVLKIGPDAYKDKKRFPGEPYCKQGDWIMMRSYSGTRFLVHGREFRLINDDSVEAIVDDPRGIVKV